MWCGPRWVRNRKTFPEESHIIFAALFPTYTVCHHHHGLHHLFPYLHRPHQQCTYSLQSYVPNWVPNTILVSPPRYPPPPPAPEACRHMRCAVTHELASRQVGLQRQFPEAYRSIRAPTDHHSITLLGDTVHLHTRGSVEVGDCTCARGHEQYS